ncbi:MAG: hypothetical protein Q4E24_14460 [bacterium]|nr:hypothetical protein [bacterium]
MTYRNCKKLIELAQKRGTNTEEWTDDMKTKLDIFLLNNRITEEEYNELIQLIDAK